MTTLSDLHIYWREQFDILHAQDDTPLRNWRLMAWLSFQLPLAMNTSVPFYKDIGPYWAKSVQAIMHNRFDNIMKAKINNNRIDDQYWNIETTALIAINESGGKVVSPPSHMEKNLAKIEAYKQQKTVLKQFLHSFFHVQTPTFYYDNSTILDLTYDKVQPLINTIERNQTVQQKSQEILQMGGFGAVSAQYGVSNEDLVNAMDRLLESLVLIQKENMPTTVASLDGCNICFDYSDVNLGSFSSSCNSIHINVENQNLSVFWHEWMHMLEERVDYSVSLQDCPDTLIKYKHMQPSLLDINKSVRTLPKDPSVSEMYFVQQKGLSDPYHLLKVCVQHLCEKHWFTDEANSALLDELQTNVPHRTYNLEAFKCLLRTTESVEQRDNAVTDLCNQWRNETFEKNLRNGTLICASHYDDAKQRLVVFHKYLKNHSNFVSAAKSYDHNQDEVYWSSANELLARSFEGFVNTQWMKHHQFSEYYPQGLELNHVVAGFNVFMRDFKEAWDKQNTQKAEPISAGGIADKRSASAPVKKRLTRF